MMTIKRITLLCCTALTLTSTAPVAAQEVSDSIEEILLVDGSRLYGVLLDDSDPIHVRLLGGDEMLIARARVRGISPARGQVRDGEFWRDDPNLTRLFFAPTARTMPKGKGYVAAYELLFPFVAVAVTNSLLVAAGTPLFGNLDEERVVYLAPKLGLYSNGLTDFAIGGFFFHEVGNSFSGLEYGALYGVLTRGTPDRAVLLAAGAVYDEDGFRDEAIVMLGAEMRVSRTIKLITENYFTSVRSLSSIGVRFFGERLSADLGVALFVDEGDVSPTLPIVNFVRVW